MRTIIRRLLDPRQEHRQQRIQELEAEVNALRTELSLLEQKLLKNPDVLVGTETIDRAWNIHKEAQAVFARYQLHGCDRCAVRVDETVEEAAEAYGFSEEAMLARINLLLRRQS